MWHSQFYAVSVNGLHRDTDRVSGRVRVSVRVRDRVRACRPDSSGNLLTRRKMEFAQNKCFQKLYIRHIVFNFVMRHNMNRQRFKSRVTVKIELRVGFGFGHAFDGTHGTRTSYLSTSTVRILHKELYENI